MLWGAVPSGRRFFYVPNVNKLKRETTRYYDMKQKLKDFFIAIWYYLSLPYYWLTTRKTEKKLKRIIAEDRAAQLTEKDVEILKSIGVETTLEELREESKKH